MVINIDKLIDYDYNMEMKRYLSKLFELDAAGLLQLEESSKLSDTVIVLLVITILMDLKR